MGLVTGPRVVKETPTCPVRVPFGSLPAVAARSGVEAQGGQEAGYIMPGTAPHWPLTQEPQAPPSIGWGSHPGP